MEQSQEHLAFNCSIAYKATNQLVNIINKNSGDSGGVYLDSRMFVQVADHGDVPFRDDYLPRASRN